MSKALRALLDFIRSIDFASIIAGVIAGFGGIWGKIASLVAKPILSGIENQVDQRIGDIETSADSDATIEQKAAAHKQEIANAQTDDDFDNAARDSLK